MTKRANQPLSFLSGVVQSQDVARVIATIDELATQGSQSSRLLKWTKQDGKWVHFLLLWQATRMWVFDQPSVEVFATGPNGNVVILTPSGSQQEVIDASPDGPSARGPIRDLRGIDGKLYACGMSRQVYRRDGSNNWVRRDQGAVLPRPTPKGGTRPKPVVVGFNSIDGMDEKQMYAVGFGGEIWRFNKKVWEQIDSPTNVVLSRVRVVRENLAFAAGQKGALLRGENHQWKEIIHDATDDDFWGMEWFKNALYLATDNAVYRLDKKDSLEKVDMGDIATFKHLHANAGVMWSFGLKDLAYTNDGTRWIRATP